MDQVGIDPVTVGKDMTGTFGEPAMHLPLEDSPQGSRCDVVRRMCVVRRNP